MTSDFQFTGYTRRIARKVVEAMEPQWPEFDPQCTEAVLEQVEDMVRNYPPATRLGVVVGLYGVEFAGAPLGFGLKPLSFLNREAATRRLERFGDHPLPQVRMLVMLLKIMTCFSAYCRPDIEEFLGVRRREWRAQRKVFHEQLVQIDLDRDTLPATPEALGAPVDPSDYLRFDIDRLLAEGPAACKEAAQ